MKVAAYQAPLYERGSISVVELIRAQVARCEAENVEILCCPEAILGGLADDVPSPADIALNVASGQLAALLAPLESETVCTIVGFTESTPSGALFNSAAVLHRGAVAGVYRKAYPAINHSIYSSGNTFPVFKIGELTFGIVICNDSNYVEPARSMAEQGATVLFIPCNNALPADKADVITAARNAHSARATENNLTVVVADVAGRRGSLISFGATAIYNPDGSLVAAAEPFSEGLLIADLTCDSAAQPTTAGGIGCKPGVSRLLS